jgi:hypothetical protein
MSPLLTAFAFGSGAAAGIPKATVTGTTGSPAVDSSTRAGKTIYKFTGSGSITFGVSGTCEILAIGGGGSGYIANLGNGYGGGGGGAGGYVYYSSLLVSNATYTITVGAGGVSGNNGNLTSMFNVATPLILANPGGGGDVQLLYDGYGASSPGRTTINTATALPVTTFPPFVQGNTGGAAGAISNNTGGSGGGGASSTGATVTIGVGTGGAGGNGTSNTITGSSVTYAGGGGGGGGQGTGGAGGAGGAGNSTGSGGGYTSSGNAGATNLGGGGGGSGGQNATSGNGGSGVVIVVVG